ncbi:Uncharacterised protein [Citrobacter freundii]|nr:Uncharacterised protein [Citrobacter freundii]
MVQILPYSTEMNWHSESMANCRAGVVFHRGNDRILAKQVVTGGIDYPIQLTKPISDAEPGRGVAPLLQRVFITQESTGAALQTAAKVDP